MTTQKRIQAVANAIHRAVHGDCHDGCDYIEEAEAAIAAADETREVTDEMVHSAKQAGPGTLSDRVIRDILEAALKDENEVR